MCASASCLRSRPWPTYVLMLEINCSKVSLLTSVDWHTHQAAMADGRTGHFTDIFQTRGEHCTTMPTQSLPDLSPVYAPPRPQLDPSDQFFCDCRILIKSKPLKIHHSLPETNVLCVAVVRATRIQASRLPSGATSKSSSFSTSYPVHPPTFDIHDIDWTVYLVIVLYHVIEVINSQTISETNGGDDSQYIVPVTIAHICCLTIIVIPVL